MYDRHHGDRYDRSLSTTEIAKLIRANVRALVKAGKLPTDWKYSVRTDYFAGGSAIRVRATSPRPIMVASAAEQYDMQAGKADPIRHPETGHWVRHYGECHTIEAAAVYAVLNAEHNAYNYNGSETQVDYFDVNYYGQVTLDTADGVAEALTPAERDALAAEVIAAVTERFEAGATYATDPAEVFTIIDRDDRWVMAEGPNGRTVNHGVRIANGVECIETIFGPLHPADRIAQEVLA